MEGAKTRLHHEPSPFTGHINKIHTRWTKMCTTIQLVVNVPRDNSGLNLACANGASQKFACAIFKDCAPCYHRSKIFCRKRSCFGFLVPPRSIENYRQLVSRRKARNFFQIIVTSRYFSYFKELYGASRFCLCAVTKICAPLRRIEKISMRHFRKLCAMTHMAHARIILDM